ncbi:hypothetical protein FQA39_LY17907 [Lamprigera yunnana]|nr:hypothetical protein FQA39_LY17907 [Lamprigera yunnana]
MKEARQIGQKAVLEYNKLIINNKVIGPEDFIMKTQHEKVTDRKEEKNIKKQFIKKMWVLYAEQHWTKAIDLKSTVKRLYEKLGALEFYADHETIYGMERYYTVQQCEELREKVPNRKDAFSMFCETLEQNRTTTFFGYNKQIYERLQ